MAFPSDMELTQMQQTLSALRLQNWLGQDLWSPQWWLLLAILVVGWIVWFRLADRSRIFELLTFGFMAALVITYIDATGTNSALYSYPYKIVPFTSTLVPVSLDFIPVSYMLLYQYSHDWKSFIINSTLFFAAVAFLLEPLAAYLGMYQMMQWNYFYSFLVYLVTAVVLRFIILGFHSMYAGAGQKQPKESSRLVTSPALKRQKD